MISYCVTLHRFSFDTYNGYKGSAAHQSAGAVLKERNDFLTELMVIIKLHSHFEANI